MSEKRPYPSESETRSAIVHIGRRMWLRGFASATDGNISVRLSEGELLTTPTGVCKGFMAESALVKLDMDGNVLEREGKPSSEIRLHLALYRENPGIGAVLHAHPPAASAFAAAQASSV